jgi:4-amino-4-deoxy-L-arabinose transferase-like glycosyltransferase
MSKVQPDLFKGLSTLFGAVSWSRRNEKHEGVRSPARNWLAIAAWTMILALSILRFFYLKADFPNFSPWWVDQAKYTDEGWWANGAVMHYLLGHWNVTGDYNPAVATPVWPILLSIVFHFTGVSLVAARALNVAISIATLGVVYFLVRSYAGVKAETPAILAVLLLSASPFAFVFSRLAILDSLVIFEFCLALLIASRASVRHIWPLAALSILIIIMILTKTTAALLVPAVFWLAWNAMERKLAALPRLILATGVLPAALFWGYAALVSRLGFGEDYKYFFDVNGMPDIEWDRVFATILNLLHDCYWIDRVLYPTGLLILLLSIFWKRKLWSNPLFAACWIALAAQAGYILRKQGDYAPRYFLAMLAPLVLVIVLAFGEFVIRNRRVAAILLFAMLISMAANATMIFQFVSHRQYQFCDAAASIRGIVRSDPGQNPLIFGVSGSQISLMTGIPSINDSYGTQDMAEKLSVYKPGWYLAWNGIFEENRALLSPFQLEEVASYPAFDDEERNKLILYKMVRRADASGP